MHNTRRVQNIEVDDHAPGWPEDPKETSRTLAWLDPDWSIVRWIKNWMNSGSESDAKEIPVQDEPKRKSKG